MTALKGQKLLKTGIIGAVVTAVCCVTPILVIAFGAAGLSAWVGGLDYVLFPLLAIFVLMIGYALHLRSDRLGSKRSKT